MSGTFCIGLDLHCSRGHYVPILKYPPATGFKKEQLSIRRNSMQLISASSTLCRRVGPKVKTGYGVLAEGSRDSWTLAMLVRAAWIKVGSEVMLGIHHEF